MNIPERFDVFMLTLNRFNTLFWCFRCWLWTSKCRVGCYKGLNVSLQFHPSRHFLVQSNYGYTRTLCEIRCRSDFDLEQVSKKPWNRFLLLTRNGFHTLFCCFHCWLWTRKCRLGENHKEIFILIVALIVHSFSVKIF